MADIPVERTGGTPWWLWLLGLILLGGLIWLGAELFDDEPDADEIAGTEDNVGLIDDVEIGDDEVEGVGTVDSGGLLTSAALLLDNPATYIGRQVELENMRVTSVVGDSTFYASPTGDVDRRFFVVLDEESTPGVQGVEGRYDVNEGQLLTIYGTVRELQRTDPGVWGITGAESTRMMDDEIYIRAQKLDISEADLDQVEVD